VYKETIKKRGKRRKRFQGRKTDLGLDLFFASSEVQYRPYLVPKSVFLPWNLFLLLPLFLMVSLYSPWFSFSPCLFLYPLGPVCHCHYMYCHRVLKQKRADIALQTRQRRDQERQVSDC
jgi:hypothetical protein